MVWFRKYINKFIIAAAKIILPAAILSTSSLVSAGYLIIDDMSQVKYETDPSGYIYLRNISELAAAPDKKYPPTAEFGPCCYSYYVDTSTQHGRLLWTTILTAIVSGKKLVLHTEPGATRENPLPVVRIGN